MKLARAKCKTTTATKALYRLDWRDSSPRIAAINSKEIESLKSAPTQRLEPRVILKKTCRLV